MLRRKEELDPLMPSSMSWLSTDHLPHVTSVVERFLPDLSGVADGMILTNGIEVCFAPSLSAAILTSVRPGDRVTVYGELVRAMPVISAAVIETMDGRHIADDLSPHGHDRRRRESQPPRRRKLKVEARLRRTLYGPTGGIRGGLLDEGTIIRLPPGEVGTLAGLLRPSSWLVVRGEGSITELGTVIEAAEIGSSTDSLRPVMPGRVRLCRAIGCQPSASSPE
jgi:hypothetical protein